MLTAHRSETAGAYAALAIGVLCIGCSAIFVKLADIPGPSSAFYRMLISGVVLVPWRLARGGSWPTRSMVRLIVAGGCFYALDLALWNTSLRMTSAAMATLLANNAPLWVGLGALFLFHEKLSSRYWTGLCVSLAGMVVLMGVQAWSRLSFDTGELLAIGASVAYAGYMLTTQRARSITPAAAKQLSIVQQPPTTATAGTVISPAIQVQILDAFGNLVTSNHSTVVVKIASGPSKAKLSGTTSVAAVNGVATLSALKLATPGTYTLKLTDGSLTPVTTGTLTIA